MYCSRICLAVHFQSDMYSVRHVLLHIYFSVLGFLLTLNEKEVNVFPFSFISGHFHLAMSQIIKEQLIIYQSILCINTAECTRVHIFLCLHPTAHSCSILPLSGKYSVLTLPAQQLWQIKMDGKILSFLSGLNVHLYNDRELSPRSRHTNV